MTGTSYDVRIWKTEVYRGKKRDSYRVRWTVDGAPFKESFRLSAQAESFRSQLVTAAKQGEAFSTLTGLPVSMMRVQNDLSWFDFCVRYVDHKWPHAAGNSRKGIAEALVTATPAMLTAKRGRPADDVIRRALNGWAFNTARRDTVEQPAEIAKALAWLRTATKPMSVLAEPREVRGLIDLISVKLDGKPAASSVVRRKRAILHNLGEYAVEQGLVKVNPITTVKWKAPKAVRAVDARVVVNPAQAKALLAAVRVQRPSGPRLVAFFASIYYAGMRPAEAVNLRRPDLTLPAGGGWGEAQLWQSAPETGASWSETGQRRDLRQLKHREVGETRPVPIPPPLTAILQAHLAEFGTDADGYLFRGVRGVAVFAESTYSRAWRAARRKVFTDEEYASPLARRAYDLRHACVSTWLNGGVDPTQVAQWAGHSLAVLFAIYAKCISGRDEIARQRIEGALGIGDDGTDAAAGAESVGGDQA